MIDLAVNGIKNAVDPESPDHLRFTENAHRQPLVDAAFLAEGILRAPVQLWGNLAKETQQNLINEFDEDGWLRVGFTGAQLKMSESYINTGSEYLVCAGFCALGLPADDPFWTNPYAPWTGKMSQVMMSSIPGSLIMIEDNGILI